MYVCMYTYIIVSSLYGVEWIGRCRSSCPYALSKEAGGGGRFIDVPIHPACGTRCSFSSRVYSLLRLLTDISLFPALRLGSRMWAGNVRSCCCLIQRDICHPLTYMREPTYLPTLFEGPLVPGNGLLLQATWRMSRPRQKGLWLVCGMWYVVCAKQLKSWGEASCWKEVKR